MRTTETLPRPLIPLHTPEASLEAVGGKGANLVRLANAGFTVPDGFLIPTAAYRDFVGHNGLEPWLAEALQDLDASSPPALEAASAVIRARFEKGEIPIALKEALRGGLHWLGGGPVAVRSSATAEDLPDLSFAGQQDTFLNVVGPEALEQAVVRCWSSLWTARAIGYRARNDIPHEEVSLSVVVQNMVQSEASGVLFTANPLTGLRAETVIDATLGLGEALVGGHVEPDHYVVDDRTGAITHKTLGSKAVAIHGQPGGGVVTEETGASQRQAIPDGAILQLAETGRRIEALYGFPQDIEWAWEAERIYILQSRPITSLFPLPEGATPEPLEVYFSFGAVQGLLDPMTPLGQDAIRFVFAGAGRFFDMQRDQETQGVFEIAGERLWGNLTPVARHPLGAKMMPRVFPIIEPGSLEALKQILADPRLQAGQGRLRMNTFWRVGKFMARMLRKALSYARRPEDSAVDIRQRYEARVEELKRAAGDTSNLEEALALYHRELRFTFIYAVPEIAIGALAGLLPLLLLNRFSKRLTGSGELALAVTRGLPNNVTTEMDLVLWETARTIRRDPAATRHMQETAAAELAAQYREKSLPQTAQEAIEHFMGRYGMRGLGEIDIGRARWRENPAPVMRTLQSYLQIEDENMAPDVVFRRSAQSAADAESKLEAAARKTTLGAFKARIIRGMVRRVRALGGLRESPKFYIIQVMGVVRRALLSSGERLARHGVIERPDDLFFLYYNELQELAGDGERDWKALAAERRADYQREMRRRQVPRLLLSDGRAFYEGMLAGEEDGEALRGSPVSPGSVEGVVRVVLDPHKAELAPGEILVCPGTDPAWTPLFLAAGGLVMEVGGMMTHGAIVAREYGIPAVVGVDRATERLKTGERVRVDGNTGRIEWV